MEKKIDGIYNEILEEFGNEFKNSKKERIAKWFGILAIVIVVELVMYFCIDQNISIVFGLFGAFLLLFLAIRNRDKSIEDFKTKIVSKIAYDFGLEYSYKQGIDENFYKKSKLPEHYNEYRSKDLILGRVENGTIIKFAKVNTSKIVYKNVNGQSTTDNVKTFSGIFGYGVLDKNINTTVLIDSNDFKKKYNKNRIELESSDFEKKFDCFSENPVIALQILTTEVVDEIVKIFEQLNKPMQIKIENNMIYFRFSMEDIYNPPRILNALGKERLNKIYNAVDASYSIIERISNNIIQI